jgi:glycosyltransferase involved in cell wall biosynthesis
LFLRTRQAVRESRYDILHSHEEAAFFAMGIAKRHGLIHIYDMHSSLPQQLKNFKAYDFGFVRKTFEFLERRIINTCDGVITICQELADAAKGHCADKPHSMIENTADDQQVFAASNEDIRQTHGLNGRYVVLYTGTFETYQGLDTLLPAFARVHEARRNAHLLMVGGREEQVVRYREVCAQLRIEDAVSFVGTVHPSKIPSYLSAADAIVSPRSRGTNTPLKIYGYMRSGKPLVATDMPTHTQTLDADTALLVPPTDSGLAEGILKLMADPALGVKLAEGAAQRAKNDFSDAGYIKKVNEFYTEVIKMAARGRVQSETAAAYD